MKKILLTFFALFITTMSFAVERITVAEFLEKKDKETTYELTGIVKSITNTNYGNFYLEQNGSTLFIYGTVDASGSYVWSSLGVNVGDSIVVQGAYTEYNGTPEIVDALYISHKANEDTPDTPTTDIKNTPETAYTATEALALIEAGEGLQDTVYVKGTVLPDDLSISTSYGNATYYISDGTNSLYIYRGYYLENHKFTSEEQLQDGDEVIVYGLLTTYNSTPEMTKSYIYSKNGQTKDDSEDEPTTEIGGLETFENGGFEAWKSDSEPTGWKSTTTASSATLSQSTDAHSGTYSCRIANATSNKRLGSKEFKLPAGWYTFNFYCKSATGTPAEARPGYAPWDASKNAMGTYVYGDYTDTLSDTDWTFVTFTFQLEAETQINLVVMNPKSSDKATYGDLLVDDAEFREATGEEIAASINAISVNENENENVYNVAGQRVNNNFKGIVIKNGRKYMK